MVRLTLIARVSDGLPLAEGLDSDKDHELDGYKQQAKVRPCKTARREMRWKAECHADGCWGCGFEAAQWLRCMLSQATERTANLCCYGRLLNADVASLQSREGDRQ